MGFEPIVGSLSPAGPVTQQLEAAGIETFACNARGPTDLSCLARLAKVIRNHNPDLIHSSLFHANLACRLVGKLDRPRPIITSTVTIEQERRWHLWLESATIGLSDIHVANSRAVATHLANDLGIPANRICVIRNGLDLTKIESAKPIDRAQHGISQNQKLIVWAGRMDPVKNLKVLIEVIDRLSANFDLRAVLLGDGPSRPEIESLIHERALTNQITLLGWSPEVVCWLKSADALIFPSFTEGSPNVVLEAMASGCPVIASNIPACRELIQNHVSGRLIPPENAAAFTQAATEILANKPLAQSLAAAASATVQLRHDIRVIASQWSDLYLRLLKH
jgi:glycosyltransferase involved in cell wall biosynthesis